MMTWTPEKIAALRKQYKLSKRALGDLTGVSTNYVYYLEKGVRNPSKTLCLLLDRIDKELRERKRKGGDKIGQTDERNL